MKVEHGLFFKTILPLTLHAHVPLSCESNILQMTWDIEHIHGNLTPELLCDLYRI